jgi:aspartate/methionine/tyrosine aminotransferase
MKDTPIGEQFVKQAIHESGIRDVGKASIREIVKLVNLIEKSSGEKFIRMEMGVPGLSPSAVGVSAEIQALEHGVASVYPMIEGVDILKEEISRFAKLFLNVNVNPVNCLPTVGSMQGAMATFMVTARRNPSKDTTLFIDPGFPVQKQQHRVLGLKYRNFDVYEFRGEKLRNKLESVLKEGNISSILYSNPNNPSWICFTEKELAIIGELATKYGAIVIEDLAYFGMDFRKDYSRPGVPPFQPTVANYTKDYILLVSSSKIFSYAGQRIGSLLVSDSLFTREFSGLESWFGTRIFGRALVYGALYSLSSGCSHSAQYALAAMLKAANDGVFDFVEEVKEYGRKAAIMKELFIRNGFSIVYDKDEDQPLADGFYFTISYPGFSGAGLLAELLFYGISAITLDITGSDRTEGLRACVSQVLPEQFPALEKRLMKFRSHHPVG